MIKSKFEEEGTCLKVWDVEEKQWLTEPKESYDNYQEAMKYLGIHHRNIRNHTNNKTHTFCERLQKKICFRIKKIEPIKQAA